MNTHCNRCPEVDVREVFDTPRVCGGPVNMGPRWTMSIKPDPFLTEK